MRKFFVALALVAAISLTVYPVVPSLQAKVIPAVEVQHADYQQLAYDQSAPLIAALLSFVVPGLGQIFLGEVGRGLVILGIFAAIWIVAVYLTATTILYGGFFGIFYLLDVAFWIWNIYDAYQLGIKKVREKGNDEDRDGDEGSLLQPYFTPVHVFE